MRRCGAVLGAVLLLPALGMAEEAAEATTSAAATAGEATAEAKAKPKFPVGATIIYDNSLGLGTFVANEYARNPSWAMSLSLRPSLTLWQKLSLQLRVDVNKNLLTSYQGNLNADASAESYMRQLTVSDVMFTAASPELYREPVTGVGIGASLTTYLPTSMVSRATTQLVAFRPGLSVDWAWEGLELGYGFLVKKNFQDKTNAVIDTNNISCSPTPGAFRPDDPPEFTDCSEIINYRPGGNEDLGDGRVANGLLRNTSHIVYNSMNIGYTFFDQLTLSASLFIINYFKYTQELSEYSSEYATASGQIDYTWGTLEVAYQPWENLGFALGVSSLQTAFTADNRQFRFPFYDFLTPGDNLSSFYFDIIGTI